MGALIEGVGTTKIIVEGVSSLNSTNIEVIPDRIEAGTFLIAGAVLGKLKLINVIPSHLDSLISKLKEVGCSLKTTKKSITIPVLRKDFILDSIQVYESKMLGADCILLIIAALTQDAFKELYNLAISLNLDVLVEVHDIDELNFALSCNAKLIGINNRNLKTFDVDINASLDLSKHISDSDVAIVSESGITNRDDIYKLNKSGIYTFLIGEHLVKSKDIKKSLGEFVNEV